jgi:hypothetical protein
MSTGFAFLSKIGWWVLGAAQKTSLIQLKWLYKPHEGGVIYQDKLKKYIL